MVDNVQHTLLWYNRSPMWSCIWRTGYKIVLLLYRHNNQIRNRAPQEVPKARTKGGTDKYGPIRLRIIDIHNVKISGSLTLPKGLLRNVINIRKALPVVNMVMFDLEGGAPFVPLSGILSRTIG